MSASIFRGKVYLHSLFILPILVFLLSGLCAPSLRAQATASLEGAITDTSGAVVVGAKVVAKNVATGLTWTAETNADGNYLFPALPPGVYRVEVSREGFQTFVITGLKLDVATKVAQNAQLKLGAVSQQVVVTGVAPVIQTGTMTVGQVINQATVQNIPLNGRHIEDLIQLVPGSMTPPANGFLTAPLRGQGSFGAITAGNREDTVNFLVNGINLNDMVQNQTTFQPSISTVSEFKLLNSTVSPQYGHTSGSIMSVVTRSGTNAFHGELFDFVRNNYFDAKNFFDNPNLRIPPFKRNDFGVNVGGPIWRNKAFFFYSFEGLHQRQQVTFNDQVPSTAERASVTDPVALALLPLIPTCNVPTPTTCTTTFAGSGSAPVDVNQNTLDLFFNLTSSDQLHGYFARQRDDRHEPSFPVSFATIPGFGDVRSGRRNLLTLGWMHTFSPSVVNELNFGGNRIKIKFGNLDTHDPASFGMVGQKPSSLPEIQIQGLGSFGILDFGGGGLAFPQGRFDTTYVWGDTLSWLHGNHTWKFGTEIRKFFNNNFLDPVGLFVFSDFTHFAAGKVNQFAIDQGSANNAIGTDSLGFFAQDSYKLRRNFTLEYGFRLEWNTTPTERFNRFVAFNPSSVNLSTRTASLAQVNVTPGFNQIYSTAVNYMPRFGFAWDLFGTGTTVLRGGYGIFFDQPVTNSISGLNNNPPFLTPVLINAPPSFANPFAGTPSTGRPLNVTTIDPNFKNPYVQQWNLNFERQIGRSLGLTIGYYGSKGTHLRLNLNGNQPNFALPLCSTVTPPTSGITGLKSPTPVCFVQLTDGSFRPLNVLTDVSSVTNSTYNGLWITANERLWHGLQFVTYYSYSHSIDNNSLSSTTAINVQNSLDVAGNRGSSDFDARHRFVSSLLYDLPFRGHHAFLPSRFVEGWSADTILTLQTGNPINITLAGASPLTNAIVTVRPDLVGNPGVAKQDPSGFFNPLAFAAPPSGQFGDLGRNVLTGPPFKDLDFAIHKTTAITERVKIEFRTEVFNLFNHPNFGNPNLTCNPAPNAFTVSSLPGQNFPAGTCIPNSSFGTTTDTVTGKTLRSSLGTITSTRSPTGDAGSARQLQFALKLIF